MTPFVFNTVAGLVMRPGSAAELGAIAAGRLGPRILFVTDAGIRGLGLDGPARASLEATGAGLAVFDGVEADPSLATLEAAIAAARSLGATGVVGFGGGSSLDVAKLAALIAGSGETLEEAWGVGKARGPRLPLILVPTTAGTGSEATPVAVITVAGAEKRGVSSPVLLPDLAVLDAELTLTLPAPATAATGIDAMVHAIEAYASASPNNNRLSRMLAVEALDLLGAHIRRAVEAPEDRRARAAMLLGSTLAGMAFANAPVAAVHALAYPIGGMFKVPHGLSNALVLAPVLRFNAAAPECGPARLYAALARHAFADLDAAGSAEDEEGARALCARFIDRLAALPGALGLPVRLRDVGVPETALAGMAAAAMTHTRLLVNNPRPVGEADALAIYRAAW